MFCVQPFLYSLRMMQNHFLACSSALSESETAVEMLLASDQNHFLSHNCSFRIWNIGCDGETSFSDPELPHTSNIVSLQPTETLLDLMQGFCLLQEQISVSSFQQQVI